MNVRISTLLAVLALSLTATLLVGAGPASAADPATQDQVDNARRAAAVAVALSNNPECFQTVSRGGNLVPPDRLNPLAVVGAVPVGISFSPLAQEPRAFASIEAADAGRGTAARGEITVYPPFATLDFTLDTIGIFDTARIDLTRSVSREDLQTLTILHEVAHLTGALPPEARLGPPPAGATRQVGQVFNTKLLVYCLRAAKFKESNPPVRISGVGCHAHYYGIGGRRFSCQASWSGGTDPVVAAWSAQYLDSPGPTYPGGTSASGHCPSANPNTVTLKVTDAQGWTDEVTVPTGCPDPLY
jgi:hypothetical protein